MTNKPSVKDKSFIVEDGDGTIFTIRAHNQYPEYFTIEGLLGDVETNFSYLKTTVWQLIDKKQWIIQ